MNYINVWFWDLGCLIFVIDKRKDWKYWIGYILLKVYFVDILKFSDKIWNFLSDLSLGYV